MKHNYALSYKRVLLRPLEEKDIEELRVLRNKNQQYFNSTAEITPEQQKAWFKRYLEKDDDCMFAVELVSKPGVFIGAVAFYDINWEAGTAEGGRTVIDKERAPEKGIGVELSATCLQIAYGQMGLKETYCYVHKDNERAIKMNQHTGYQIVGERGNEWRMTLPADKVILLD